MATLVIAEHDHGTLKPATFNTVTAALACGGEVHVLIAGANASGAAQAAAKIAGVAKVLHADAASLAEQLAENVAAQVLAIARNYSHLLFPATAHGKNVAPRVAALLDVAQISDASKVISADTFERADLRRQRDRHGAEQRRDQGDHRAHHRLRRGGGQWRQRQRRIAGALWPTAACRASSAARSPRATGPSSPRPRSSSRAAARWARRDKFTEVLTPLADKLGAALGASRAAVDAGYAPNDWQVGQTGKIVAPQLYIACGISGAIQHLAGMKDSKVIVAINKDPEAPIFSVADYGLEADLFTAVPELVKSL